MQMFNPPHPGEILFHRLIEDEDGKRIDSIANTAIKLGCHRNSLNRLINSSASVSIEMALALEKLTGSSAKFWLTLQIEYDLFHARAVAS